MKELLDFLIEAKIQTYANENVEKVDSSRQNSIDYEYKNETMTYHDTYFGGTNFMGEEIIYTNEGLPIWGMNYYGRLLDDSLTEEAMDKALRPALMLVGQSQDVLPLRGPKEYVNNEYKYTFDSNGTLSNFEGTENIYKNDIKIYELKCHGGSIRK